MLNILLMRLSIFSHMSRVLLSVQQKIHSNPITSEIFWFRMGETKSPFYVGNIAFQILTYPSVIMSEFCEYKPLKTGIICLMIP